MTILPISEARSSLSDLGNRVSLLSERVIIERRGKNLFAIVPLEDLELLEQLEDKMDLDVIRERLDEPSVSLEKLVNELGL